MSQKVPFVAVVTVINRALANVSATSLVMPKCLTSQIESEPTIPVVAALSAVFFYPVCQTIFRIFTLNTTANSLIVAGIPAEAFPTAISPPAERAPTFFATTRKDCRG